MLCQRGSCMTLVCFLAGCTMLANQIRKSVGRQAMICAHFPDRLPAPDRSGQVTRNAQPSPAVSNDFLQAAKHFFPEAIPLFP